MIRSCLFGMLVATLGCTSRPLCAPWSPSTATTPTATALPAPSTQASTETHEAHGDGTVFLSGPSQDEEWTSVVGKGEPPVAAAPAPATATAARPKRAARPAPAVAAAPSKPAKASSPQPKPAAAAAAPAKAAAPDPANGALRAQAREIYAGRCVPCHGASGRGDGPAGGALTPHPRNFTDKAWQSTVNATHIAKVIANGGPSVGKSPLMPAQADLAQNPALLQAVAQYVQEFGR